MQRINHESLKYTTQLIFQITCSQHTHEKHLVDVADTHELFGGFCKGYPELSMGRLDQAQTRKCKPEPESNLKL